MYRRCINLTGILLFLFILVQPAWSEQMGVHNQTIWIDGIGSGFHQWQSYGGLALGAGFGQKILGSCQEHDLAMASVYFGTTLSPVMGEGHWYRGNWELQVELFGGGQFSPDEAYFIGFAPHIRYNFATGTRLVPFFDVGGGVSETDIKQPDLSINFNFNLQSGPGIQYFFTENKAITLQYRFLHFSNAGLESPNYGVNTHMFTVGFSWFF